MLAGGWGVVLGEDGRYHIVYIPLWDPVRFNAIGRGIFASYVIRQHLYAINNAEARDILTKSLKAYSAEVGSGFEKAMFDDGDDGWCGTPYPRHLPGGVVLGGGDPADPPVYRELLGEKITAQLEAKAGISMLGRLLDDKQILTAAEMI
ncbi:hypothetical protein I5907_11615 [Panacibacter sp. DH6]|uniref:Uncharacterized protein n=2 Tax=Panacibacter microcysteis TaxID=2793269 RepID=A0A931GWW5_9BACT|nr:hypothetical protein [Panacibacter microcysteis]